MQDVTSCFSSDLIPDASMLRVQGQKNAVQVQRRACSGRDVFVKNNHVRKNLIVALRAKYAPTLCDNISQPWPDLSHFSSHYEVCSVQSGGQGRNLNVTIAESIEKLSIELRFCGVKWLFKTSIRFLIRPEWDLISKLILVNDFSGDVKDFSSTSVSNIISFCDRWKPLYV